MAISTNTKLFDIHEDEDIIEALETLCTFAGMNGNRRILLAIRDAVEACAPHSDDIEGDFAPQSTGDISTVTEEADTNDFRSWMKSMGYNAKQVSAAGDLVGMSSSLAGHSSRGIRDLSLTERLAMAAATVGLHPWTPGAAAEIEAVRTVYDLLKAEVKQASAGGGAEEEAVRTIRAVIRAEALRVATESRQEAGADPETDQAIRSLLQAFSKRASER